MKRFVLFVIIAALCIYTPFLSVIGGYTKLDTDQSHALQITAQSLDRQYNVSNQSSVLYLEIGDAAFFFRANSSCRYIAPLPLTRDRDDWNLSYLPAYQQEYNCVMQYQGKYIVMENIAAAPDWFGEQQQVRQPIMQMLNRNYTLVYNGTYRLWEKKE